MRHVNVTGDGNEFHGLAQLLAERGRYVEPVPGPEIPTAEKPPLWPLVLALPGEARARHDHRAAGRRVAGGRRDRRR